MASSKITQLMQMAYADAGGDQAAAYNSVLENLLSSHMAAATTSATATASITDDLKELASHLFSANPGVVTQRDVLESLIRALRAMDSADVSVAVGQHVLDAVASLPSGSLLDQVASLRELVGDAHETNEDFLAAARVLAEMPLDAAQRKVTNEERVRVWVRVVRDYLEVDDATSAETYLNKLKNVIYTVADPTLNLHFRLSQARIQDAKREFLAASAAYHDISLSPAVAEDERLHTLAMAARCAILAPAGPLRARALGRLYKDERAVQLGEFAMLEKMFLDRLLAPAEVARFARGLAPHQLATTSDGSTVLDKAVVEHNLLGASRLYSNIGFDALALLLGLEPHRAEETTARMIEQGRLVGRVDQIEELIWFERGEASGEKGSGRAEVTVGREMRRWDANVLGLAEEVENVTNALQREFPEFVAANMVV
ncbi:putative PCI domain-containing protein [Rosellinia necatrix]|uniref:COP9 signalosome complex subunit 4 n=1 Tax=Rosellinia necatrix TaxID=77044 RepID=A0A1W2TBD1_ROSNE|nr:putative PCI domain-containing protein [Rosellinia necatrix]